MDQRALRKTIEETADRLGARRDQVLKWRQRGIPGDWRMRLVTEGNLSPDDVDVFKEPSAVKRLAPLREVAHAS